MTRVSKLKRICKNQCSHSRCKKSKYEKLLLEIERELDIENYKDSNGTYWTVPQILFCKLEELLGLDWKLMDEEQEYDYERALRLTQKLLVVLVMK
jgi:hypothetical protein